MLSYSFQSLIYNRNKYIVLSILGLLAFAFIYFILYLLNDLGNPLAGATAEESQSSFIALLTGFVVLFVLSVAMVISAVFYMFYSTRKNELTVLRHLGASRSTIIKACLYEMAALSLIISFAGFVAGLIIAAWFMAYYRSEHVFNAGVSILYFVLTNAVFLSVAYKQLTKVLRETDDINRTPKKRRRKPSSDNRPVPQLVTGCVFIGLGTVWLTDWSMGEAVTMIGVLILVKPLIALLLLGLERALSGFRATSLLLAVQQMRFNFKKTGSLVANAAISFALIVMMFSLYHSLESSAVSHSDQMMQYDALIQLEHPVQDALLDQPGVNGALVFPVKAGTSDQELLLTGISLSFEDNEQLDFKAGSLEELWRPDETGTLSLLIPELLSINRGLKVGDTVNLDAGGQEITARIAGTFFSYNYNQIYTAKAELEGRLTGGAGLSNLLYAKEPLDETQAFLESGAAGAYNIRSKGELLEDYREGILNGTEMVETFLYVYLAISLFMIVNLFVMSMEERRRTNAGLRILGVRASRLLWMTVFEAIILITGGSVAGIVIGWVLNGGLPDFVELLFGVRATITEPLALLAIIFGIALVLTIAFPAWLGYLSLKGNAALAAEKGE